MLSQYTPFIYVITLGLLGASCSHLSDQQIYGASANANKEENTNSNSCAEKVSMDCIICLDNLNLKTVTTIEPCSHRFHKNCMLLLMHAQYISNKQNHEDEIARRAVQTSSQNDPGRHNSDYVDIAYTWEKAKLELSCPLCRQPITNQILVDEVQNSLSLLKAVADDDLEAVKSLLDKNANPNIAKDDDSHSVLHIVRSVEIATLLINQGADINAQNRKLWTPLHLAADKHDTEMVKLLIDNHADINAQNAQLWTPLHIAAHTNDTAIMQLLIDNHADVNKPDDWLWRPLNVAVQSAHKAAMELLIQRGADINAKANYGSKMQDGNMTPLHFAVVFEKKAAVELLIEKKVDLNAQCIYGLTPLDLAGLCINDSFRQLTHDNEPPEKNALKEIITMLLPKTNLTIQNSLGLSYETLQTINIAEENTTVDLARFKEDCKKWFMNPMERN